MQCLMGLVQLSYTYTCMFSYIYHGARITYSKGQYHDSAFVKFSVRQKAPGVKRKALELLLINLFMMQK